MKEQKKNIPALNIKGWLEEPNYNEELHSLVWCILCESTNGITANYESRLLSREGYVSATLVCSQDELELAKPYLKEIISKFSFNEGKRYADYVQGKDKLSDLGLAALIVGGSAVAVKKGLLIVLLAFLKKGGIVLFVPIIAFIKKLFGRKKTHNTNLQSASQPTYTDEQESEQSSQNAALPFSDETAAVIEDSEAKTTESTVEQSEENNSDDSK